MQGNKEQVDRNAGRKSKQIGMLENKEQVDRSVGE